jgi:hypothetical protein
VTVYYAPAVAMSKAVGTSSSDVLGPAIAHEIGHVLLGSGRSADGIMKSHWSLSDLERLAYRGLQFSAEQCKEIRGAVVKQLRASCHT